MGSRTIASCMGIAALIAAGCGSEGGASRTSREPTPLRAEEQPRSAGTAKEPTPLNSGIATASPSTSAAGAPAPSSSSAANAVPSASASAASPPAAPAPKTAAECKAAAAKVTPPASNQGDVQLQMRAFFDAYRETFRCCFDALWASQNRGASGTVGLFVNIDGTGAFSSAEIDPPNTSVQSTEVQACIVDIAKSLTYPKPANGKNIRYSRVLNFSPRR